MTAAARLSVAPMMDWTDRHCRYFHRLLAPGALLYTEMVTTGALLHAGPERFLDFDPAEHPVALQLGGSEPDALARCAEMGERFGYDEINLNVGCPSDRVKSGRFGACLMAEPELVAACIAAMRRATALPVTVKCRIGIDRSEDTAFLERFVSAVAGDGGCTRFIVHARKAWLDGLSPKENRELPPLRYEAVHALKDRHPGLCIVINGGLREPDAAARQLKHVDGVMIGREAYQNPASLPAFARAVLGGDHDPDPFAIVHAMHAYAVREAGRGVPVRAIARHMLGLFNGRPGARRWRRELSTAMHEPGAGPDVLLEALDGLAAPSARTPALTLS